MAAIHGEETDRLPIWASRHSARGYEETAEEMFQRECAFQAVYDWDIARISPAAALYMEDWGCAYKGCNHLGVPDPVARPVNTVADWARIKAPAPDAKRSADIIKATGLLAAEYGKDKPVLITAFGPLTIAEKLAGTDLLKRTITEAPSLLEEALETIASSVAAFVRANANAANAGIPALYYATQTANEDIVPDARLYDRFEKGPDARLLDSIKKDVVFKLLHLHGNRLKKEAFTDLPVDVINWADRRTDPPVPLSAVRAVTRICLMGGLNSRDTLVNGGKERIENEVTDAIKQARGGGFIVSACCVLPVFGAYPEENVHFFRETVNALKR
ncbi:MAG: hypothetical protein LBD95_05420 [Clostridiales Family XIII bacterium]|jgi:uroporphyrinogen decarboxylase|nr:hypothetical protein [Clostridiales Family XIII bacterium]